MMSTSTMGRPPKEHTRSGSSVVQRTKSQGSRSIVGRLGGATLRVLGPRPPAPVATVSQAWMGRTTRHSAGYSSSAAECSSMIGRSQPTHSTSREDIVLPVTNRAGTC